FFEEAGLGKPERVVVRQNTALPKIAKVFAETPVPTLKAWHAFHLADQAAPLLSKRFVDTQFEFRSKFLNGVEEQRPRWKDALEEAEIMLGEAIGRAYVAEHFPPASKAAMETLVANLMAAMKTRIENASWMSAPTKKEALAKLANMRVKIGYPKKWQDYSKLKVVEGDLFGNAERFSRWAWDDEVSRLGKKVDPDEWSMTPQTVNAYYAPYRNEIAFPAAVLQAPFFDPNADPAMNYGAIGGGIGHEITHAFDDQGRKTDGKGQLRDWWAPEDAAKFEAEAAKLGAQYEALELPWAPGAKINPKLTMGENIADLGGILLALDGYKLSLGGKPAPVLDGFTGEQRVFLAWGQKWRAIYREDALRQQLIGDPHSPGMVRSSAPLRNVDAWYAAFGVKEGDKNYVKPEDRVKIW
ncbi:MAG TPA: M13-type metalloendopeptidase, partial [Thermoanaerobaculia bacterium]|nr:M13-type metalloendopeptidase [Thermoanaerobaculia bacterium]